MEQTKQLDVVIVGAGAAGVGCGIVLRDLGVERFALLERYEVGASFAHWPAEMRFITPSFTSNHFGLLDINAVALGTSPAFTLQKEHPTGPEYAEYLQAIAEHWELPVYTDVDVQSIQSLSDGGFLIQTSRGDIRSRFVIWAAGEFQYPWLDPFPGAQHCLHSALVPSWHTIEGDEIIVIGGYESGIDAAINLVALGKRVRVLDAARAWESDSSDPSISLSPYTHERLDSTLQTGRVELIGDARVASVEQVADEYVVHGAAGQRWHTPVPPILATGFVGSLSLVSGLFDWHEDGYALLTERDESTRTPGLFLVGPNVRHSNIIFCFIYKFRQRFAVVAQAIGERLGIDTTPLNTYRSGGMFLEDLSCCGDECVC
jgi:putative flavoprotein involved in K+ transport